MLIRLIIHYFGSTHNIHLDALYSCFERLVLHKDGIEHGFSVEKTSRKSYLEPVGSLTCIQFKRNSIVLHYQYLFLQLESKTELCFFRLFLMDVLSVTIEMQKLL